MFEATKKFNCLAVAPPESTHWSSDLNKLPDIIDFYDIKGISRNFIKVSNCLDSIESHSPVLAVISSKVISKAKNHTLATKKLDWYFFQEWLNKSFNPR